MRVVYRLTYLVLCSAFILVNLSYGSNQDDDRAVHINSSLNGEVSLIGGYSKLDEWRGPESRFPKNGAGFEYFATFSGKRGDFLSADLQVRLSHDDRSDTDSEWAFEMHNSWLRWKRGLGSHVRVGHFSPAYGLEPVTDTHGKLLQTLAMQDIGFKQDWGLGYEGLLGPFDYRTAAQLGSGMGIRHEDGSYLLSARLGSPEAKEVRFGISLLHGQVLMSSDRRLVPAPRYSTESIRKSRVGADIRVPLGAVSTSTEVSIGRNESEEVFGVMAEARREYVAGTRAQVAVQGRYWSDDPGRDLRTRAQAAVVVEHPVSSIGVIRLGLFEDLSNLNDMPLDRLLALQFYSLGL